MTSDLSQVTPRRPRAATAGLPAVASPSDHRRSLHGSPPLSSNEPSITSTAQGPLRHPKPLTPSDLHLVLEKEQEAMVNRLTRELSLLRQQTTSVTSNASSTSTLNDPTDGMHGSPSLGSSVQSHSSRRQRSSSSLSSHAQSIQGHPAASVTGIAPSRSTNPSRAARSREASLTSRRPSIGSLSSFPQYAHNEQLPHYGNSPSIYPHRNSVSQTHLGLSSAPMARYEEATLHKSELDSVRKENDQLRKRVRELEQVLKKQKDVDPSPNGTSGIAEMAMPSA
ncbi:hypothetical protein N7512_000887 [Penicillium capsulatum]|nr:hypothetical protein N7512_000887 [Penicillium capsulatum]